ncbi:hypothetical protein [Vescimonas sp.]|uniref:hypothetical protein n=1 Tax=Vescimonas sp. TaxID=2892404 RepID=UPI00307D43CF
MKTIYQTVAVDLFTVDVQILDRGVLNISQQRFATFGDSQEFAVAEDRAGESTEVILLIGIPRIKFVSSIYRASDGSPAVRQCNIGNKFKKYSIKGKTGIDRIPYVFNIRNSSNLIGAVSRPITVHIGFPRINCDLRTLRCCGRACFSIKDLIYDAIIPCRADCISRNYKTAFCLSLKQLPVTIVVDRITIPLIVELYA